MKILVTGAAGFIGYHLVPNLQARGHDVIGIDIAERWPVSLRYDIRHEHHMLSIGMMEGCAGADAIVHLAAVASPRLAQDDPDRAWSTNVQGTYNILQLARQLGCRRFVFTSTAHVYGISPKYLPTDEQHPLALQDTYTSTKITGEQLAHLFYRNAGISYVSLRLFNAYGPGQSRDYFLGVKLAEMKENRIITLRRDLKDVTKDWVHVSDVVEAIHSALYTSYVGPLNIGTGIETSLETIVQQIAEMTGSEILLQDGGDQGPTRMQAACKRARTALDWYPQVAFQEGLRELVRKEMTR